MAAMRPSVEGRSTGLKVLLAVGVGVAAAAVLIVANQLLRGTSGTPDVVPRPVVDLADIPESGTILGKPGAKVMLIEYADQQCPGCRYYTLNVFPSVVNQFVRTGKVKMEYRGFPFIGSDSVKALRFLLAAGRQDRLWQLQEALYRYQGRENSGWITDALIRDLASKIVGLNVTQLFADAQSSGIAQEADGAEAQASAAGIPGTPTFFVQIGKTRPYHIDVALDPTQFRAALDDALNG
jgi:protein-disulfide isomerase